MLPPDMLDEIIMTLATEEIKPEYAKYAEVTGYDGCQTTMVGDELKLFLENPAEFGVSVKLYIDITLLKRNILAMTRSIYKEAGLPFPSLR